MSSTNGQTKKSVGWVSLGATSRAVLSNFKHAAIQYGKVAFDIENQAAQDRLTEFEYQLIRRIVYLEEANRKMRAKLAEFKRTNHWSEQ